MHCCLTMCLILWDFKAFRTWGGTVFWNFLRFLIFLSSSHLRVYNTNHKCHWDDIVLITDHVRISLCQKSHQKLYVIYQRRSPRNVIYSRKIRSERKMRIWRPVSHAASIKRKVKRWGRGESEESKHLGYKTL